MSRLLVAIAALVPLSLGASPSANVLPEWGNDDFELVASSDQQWTGLVVNNDGTLIMNYPRWSDNVPMSVARIGLGGRPTPFPNEEWNRYEPGIDPATHFYCVQAVWKDPEGKVWVVDTGSPQQQGVVPGAAKLLRFDPETGELLWRHQFSAETAPKKSYLNDVRVDLNTRTAYLTDSGEGALIVVDLDSKNARRLLDDHPSAHWERTALMINGSPYLRDGKIPRIHSDGIALSPDRQWIYYHALSGRTLYRIPTSALRDASLSAKALAAKVETVGQTGGCDGMLFGPDGNLYLTAIEADAIFRLTPEEELQVVVHDPSLHWPDALDVGPDGSIYFSISQIQYGRNPPGPYKVFRIVTEDSGQ